MEIDKLQSDLFGFNPEIRDISFTSFKLADGKIQITAQAVTEAADLAQLTPERWRAAVARQLLMLSDCDLDVAISEVKCQYIKIQQELDEANKAAEARQKDALAGFAKIAIEGGAVINIETSRKGKRGSKKDEPSTDELERGKQS